MKPVGAGTPSRLTDKGATNHPLRVGSRVLATTSGIVADDETVSLSLAWKGRWTLSHAWKQRWTQPHRFSDYPSPSHVATFLTSPPSMQDRWDSAVFSLGPASPLSTIVSKFAMQVMHARHAGL